jgi:hypothetical protein
MPKKKQSDSTKARRRRSGIGQWLDDVPLVDTPKLQGRAEEISGSAARSQPELLKEPRLPRTPETAATSVQVDEETVGHIATKHCLLNYPTLYTAGVPELSSSSGDKVWVAPIVLRSSIHGTLGTVGEIRMDARSGKVIDSTPSKEVVAKGRQLYEEKCGADSSTLIQPNER